MKTAPKLLLLALAAASVAAITSRDLESDLRTADAEIPFYVKTSTGTTEGREGLLLYASTATASPRFTVTGTLASPLYPTRMVLDLLDLGVASDALSCSRVVLYGTDNRGRPVTETILNLTESSATTTYSYERINKLAATGCVNFHGGAAGVSDKLTVAMSHWLPFPRVVRNIGSGSDVALVSICRKPRVSALNQTNQPAFCVGDTSALDDFTVHELSNTWDPTSGSDPDFDRGDVIFYRVRGSRW